MLYADDSGAYLVEDGSCISIGLNAKDKVVEHREIESLTVVKGSECELPEGACPATIGSIVAKFNVSEANPLEPVSAPTDPPDGEGDDGSEDPQAEEQAAEGIDAEMVDPEKHTKAELEGMCAELGIEVPAKATKQEIAALINEA